MWKHYEKQHEIRHQDMLPSDRGAHSRNPGQITLVAIGPLTNVAVALLIEPRINSAIKELVIMGGIFL